MERGLSRNTVLAYASDLEQFLSYCDKRGQNPLALVRSGLEDYLWELKSKQDLEATTLFRKIEALRSAMAGASESTAARNTSLLCMIST